MDTVSSAPDFSSQNGPDMRWAIAHYPFTEYERAVVDAIYEFSFLVRRTKAVFPKQLDLCKQTGLDKAKVSKVLVRLDKVIKVVKEGVYVLEPPMLWGTFRVEWSEVEQHSQWLRVLDPEGDWFSMETLNDSLRDIALDRLPNQQPVAESATSGRLLNQQPVAERATLQLPKEQPVAESATGGRLPNQQPVAESATVVTFKVDTEVCEVAESATPISEKFARSPEPNSDSLGDKTAPSELIEKTVERAVPTVFNYREDYSEIHRVIETPELLEPKTSAGGPGISATTARLLIRQPVAERATSKLPIRQPVADSATGTAPASSSLVRPCTKGLTRLKRSTDGTGTSKAEAVAERATGLLASARAELTQILTASGEWQHDPFRKQWEEFIARDPRHVERLLKLFKNEQADRVSRRSEKIQIRKPGAWLMGAAKNQSRGPRQ